jgi:hypothetical protein
MGAGMSFIFAHRLPAVNSHQIRESNPAALRNTTAKKMNDKKINEGKTGISESYIHAVHLLFPPSCFLFRLGSARNASHNSAKSGDKSSHSKTERFPAAKRPDLRKWGKGIWALCSAFV